MFVEVVGRLDHFEEPRLYSDPPLPKDQIWALLLGGTTDEEQSGSAASAYALNRILQDTPLSKLQITSGSTRRGEAVQTASYQLSERIWIDYRAVTANERSLIEGTTQSTGVVDWRFHPDWDLRGEFGQAFGLEIRWRYRY